MSIKAGRHQNKFRLKSLDSRDEQLAKRSSIISVSCPRFKRYIQRCSQARPRAFFIGPTCAWVTGIGRLMEGGIEHTRIRLEGVLRAVAVVNIPVDDEDSFQVVNLLKMAGSNGHIIKQTKAQGGVSLGMMARRSHQAKGISNRTFHDSLSCCQHRPDRQTGYFVRLRANPVVR